MPTGQYRFSIKMFDFSGSNLESTEPYLKLDFDKFKLFQTDKEKSGNPEWGFKAAFMYRTKTLDKLPTKKFRIFCFDAAEKCPVDKVSVEVDLATLACGPQSIKLIFHDSLGNEAGILQFMCIMKMFRPDVTLSFDRICLTMQGSPAPARLVVSLDEESIVNCPYSATGEWGDIKLICETSLSELLSVSEPAVISVKAYDEHQDVSVGEVKIPVRSHFTLDTDRSVTVEQNVYYSMGDSNESMTVGELAATLTYKNLPTYAQMEGGILLDDEVEGGFLLFEGLPYPARCKSPPPVFEEELLPEKRQLIPPDPGEQEDNEPNINIGVVFAEVKDVDMPPYWEMKKTAIGRPYFVDHRTLGTSWKDPRFLPENWDQRIDPDTGKVYYAYHKTRQTTYKDPRGSSEFWEMRLSQKGQEYYIFLPLKVAHWCDSRGLPKGFEACLDKKGRMYFRDHNERSVQWDDPRGDASDHDKKKLLEEEQREWWKNQYYLAIEKSAKEAREAAEREDDDIDELRNVNSDLSIRTGRVRRQKRAL